MMRLFVGRILAAAGSGVCSRGQCINTTAPSAPEAVPDEAKSSKRKKVNNLCQL